ncbi:MAG TPA: hypothetical protein VIH28_10980 [Ignavibacteriaceae bacterium]
MNITEQVENILINEKSKFESEKKYQDFLNLYHKLKTKGILIKKEYDIPLMDTLGRTSLFKSTISDEKFSTSLRTRT